jgi:hypothetical protein
MRSSCESDAPRVAATRRTRTRTLIRSSWHMRTQAQINTQRHGLGNPSPQHTNYVWPNDDFADKQDAAKIIIPAGTTNYEQCRFGFGLGADFLGVSTLNALYTWDFYRDASWVTGHAQMTSGNKIEGFKAFQLARHNRQIWFEQRLRFLGTDGYVGYTDSRFYQNQGAVYVPPTTSGGITLGGKDYGGDTNNPQANEFGVAANKWTRYWLYVEMVSGSLAVNASFWIADEDRDAVQINNGLTFTIPDNTGSGAQGLMHQIWWEDNYSTSRATGGQMIAYGRNVAILVDVPDPTAYLQRPVR